MARVGGEEFILLLPDTSLKDAAILASRVSEEIVRVFEEIGTMTISLGITELTDGDNIDSILKRVDSALCGSENGSNVKITRENKLYGAIVIGHKNPDTDSICSAIAYANLKSRSEDEHIPKRAGVISDETRFVLEKFKIEAPEYIEDVGTQVRDIEIRKTEGAHNGISLKKRGI